MTDAPLIARIRSEQHDDLDMTDAEIRKVIAAVRAHDAELTAAEVCHDEQMTIWAGEVLAHFVDWLDPTDYEDTLAMNQAAADAARDVIESAFNLAAWNRRANDAANGTATVPDFFYDPDEWESSMAWEDRADFLTEYECSIDVGDIKKFSTLHRGPDKYAACLVLTRDEDGDPDETELRWLTDDEATAMLAAAQEDATDD
mgnify:CR=1 FL=1